MHTLYDNLPSGNGYKCRLAMHQLGIPFRRVEKDILRGETRTPEFFAKNPNGRIPLLELEDGRLIAESNAILLFVADESALVPSDPYERALADAMALLRAVQPRAERRDAALLAALHH
jgi:glutathione S-transferase